MSFAQVDDMTWVNVGKGPVEFVRQTTGHGCTINFRSGKYIRIHKPALEVVNILSGQ